MSSRVAIRTATPADAAAIARIYMDSAEHHARLDPERYYIPDAAAIEARYREGRQHPAGMRERSTTLVAECDGAVCGFVDARLDRPFDPMHRPVLYCYIAEVAVASERRSRGIGERLVRAAEDWGRANGAAFAFLDYNAANERAVPFYHGRLGYRRGAVLAVKRL